MSYSTLKGIYVGDKTTNVVEMNNSWGSSPVVWEVMAKNYIAETPGGYLMGGSQTDFWEMWKRRDIPIEYRLVFLFTLDHGYVLKKDYPRMASAIRKFLTDFDLERTEVCGRVNHWHFIQHQFETCEEPALALWGTSVSQDPWKGEYDEDADEYGPVDWSKAYDIFELSELQQEFTVSA
jgi:hypothetical protein